MEFYRVLVWPQFSDANADTVINCGSLTESIGAARMALKLLGGEYYGEFPEKMEPDEAFSLNYNSGEIIFIIRDE